MMMFSGTRIRELRKRKKMSLTELAQKSGLSAATISQIERDNVDPTLTTLYKICKALDITLASLISNNGTPERVVRRNDRKTMFLPNSKVKYQLLTPGVKDNLEMLLIELEPKQEDRQVITHTGEECGFVLRGKMVVVLDDEEYELEEGDSIYFDSSIPHRFINRGEEKCVSIWAMTPPTF
ncbi:MAG: XRE family transcriptional regulator [Novibacillus thermophilus]|jgi:transcriptional regulator with XRE-family HTH domain